MSDGFPPISEAVVICTRNRPGELRRTLRSVAAQSGAEERLVLVIDGSDHKLAEHTATVIQNWHDDRLPFYYHRFAGPPAGTRQRNIGIDLLPSSVTVVHFIDDDVTLQDEYFDTLINALRETPSLLGVGGLICPPENGSSRPRPYWVHRLFLLRTDQPNRVLRSGQTTSTWRTGSSTQPAEWLSTCASSYRRSVFQTHRFDPEATGPSPRLEDLDFSYRVAQEGPLAVVPEAKCVHHVSPRNRRSGASRTRERIARRYWFIEKNLDHPLNRLAFWWSVVGQFVALVVSSKSESRAGLRGILQGIRTVWSRNHPLLRRSKST
jgi:GT2 family glycosyltransferase